jgi:hypothetical protein
MQPASSSFSTKRRHWLAQGSMVFQERDTASSVAALMK